MNIHLLALAISSRSQAQAMARFHSAIVALLGLIVFLSTYFGTCAFPSFRPKTEIARNIATKKEIDLELSIVESFKFFEESDSRWFLRKLIHSHQAAVERSQAECFHLGGGPCVGRKW